jgi:hypothetical protein
VDITDQIIISPFEIENKDLTNHRIFFFQINPSPVFLLKIFYEYSHLHNMIVIVNVNVKLTKKLRENKTLN